MQPTLQNPVAIDAAIRAGEDFAVGESGPEMILPRSRALRLDLGAGAKSPEGFTPRGNVNGTAIYPLPYPDGSVDEIRASHVLEHFPRAEIASVLADWVRALKPGGALRIAVPDYEKLRQLPAAQAQPYLMGGQVDAADHHHVVMDADVLKAHLAHAGLILLRPWQSELADDCAALPISLNWMGVKPRQPEPHVRAVMTTPRLGFNDMWNCAATALPKLGIELTNVSGAYWEQCLTLGIERALDGADDVDYILTLDYDSVFHAGHVAQLIQLAMLHPEADAIAPLQSSRHGATPLFGVEAKDILARDDTTINVERSDYEVDLKLVPQAHFGLTLIRVDKLKALPRPWLHGQPNGEGDWKPGKVDPDISFWRKWRASGFTLMLAPRVVIGHLELMVRWPDQDMQSTWQPAKDWEATHRPPANVWTGI